MASAIARLEGRFGARAVVRGSVTEQQGRERRCATGTSLDALTHGGIAPGSALALVGTGSSGKLSIAFRAAVGAQREGGMVAWVDPSRSFDPVAAWRAGVDLERVIVARASDRDAALIAIGAALRGEGFRLVVADLGPGFAAALSPDDLAPVLPMVRGSAAALLVTSEERSTRLGIPTYALEHIAWEQRFGRTTGWTFAVRRIGDHRKERAIFHLGSLGRDFLDLGLRASSSKDRRSVPAMSAIELAAAV